MHAPWRMKLTSIVEDVWIESVPTGLKDTIRGRVDQWSEQLIGEADLLKAKGDGMLIIKYLEGKRNVRIGWRLKQCSDKAVVCLSCNLSSISFILILKNELL